MSVARHHAEWLSLVETSGPFLSMPVLLRVFPQGLEQRDSTKASRLREAYEDWLERGTKQPAVHHAWIRHVLTELLEYPTEFLVEGQAIPPGMEAVMANFGETLRPDFVLLARESDSSPSSHPSHSRKPLLLIEHYAPDQDLEKPVAGKIWKASPGTRMMELLHAADVPLGLVTNGEQWMIVYAPRGETTGFASWYADLWMQEPLTLRAFHSLLHLRRFLGVDGPNTLAALYAESSKDQQEVTDQLGYQVRRAVEMLVQAFDRIDAESERKLLADVSEKDLYNSALTVMMRLVFLFSADERGLLLLGDPLYDQHYAVSTLSEILRERADQHGEEVLERRHDAWCRLLATFRAVHGGVKHEAMRLPPYGGTLFDPDRYPFLEGRAADTHWRSTLAKPLPINNRVVLHLLEALQVLRVKVPGGGQAEARRLSFRALDIEQIGHVYEGLLDHTAKRASEVTLSLERTREAEKKGKCPDYALGELERLFNGDSEKLLEALAENTGRSESPLRKLLEQPATIESGKSGEQILPLRPAGGEGRGEVGEASGKKKPRKSAAATVDDHALLLACGNDPLLAKRVKPFAALLREDDFGQLVVIPAGSVFVTRGSDRRSTGTHYTPRSLTEPIVQHTLEPLVYTGPAEGKPQAEWQLKSPREILALKVCDMTMGSGAFLVQTCRYLAERLVEAWENTERAANGSSPANTSPSPPAGAGGEGRGEVGKGKTPQSAIRNPQFIVTPEGDLSTGDPKERLIPADPAERVAIARRYVADRCLYGVDINPMAVEMAKLSLWLITLQRDRPFTFLDHALKCGDSLLGVSSVQQIENFSLRPGERQVTFATANLFRYVEEASAKRRALEDLPSNDHTQIETKNRLHAEAEATTAKVKALADCLIALELRGLDGDIYEDARETEADQVQRLLKQDADAGVSQLPTSNSQLLAHANERLRGRRPFHWPVEFPEVFARGGFDSFVGNPPFLGGKRIAPTLGDDYSEWMKERLCSRKGAADLCIYFLRRASHLGKKDAAHIGLIQTDTLTQGDTREVGLEALLEEGNSVFFAESSQPWPGVATVRISIVGLITGPWNGRAYLDGKPVDSIDAYLAPARHKGSPEPLVQNKGYAFIGVTLLGDGFILSKQEAHALIEAEPQSKGIVRPFLNGKEFNSSPDLKPTRFVLDFGDMSFEDAGRFPIALAHLEKTVGVQRSRLHRQIHEECFWKFWDKRKALQRELSGQKEATVRSLTSKHFTFAAVSTLNVLDQTLLIFPKPHLFSILQSTIHEVWSLFCGAALGATPRYSLSDCFQTFPFPGAFLDESKAEMFARLLLSAKQYTSSRADLMGIRGEGLNKTYNRFHDRGEQSADIARLRALHVEMDQAVAAAYGWSDLDLGHGFHATKQGERYTLSESARRTVLDRLLALNHQRHAEELAAGLHEKGSKKGTKPRSHNSAAAPPMGLVAAPQADLFG